MVNYLDFGGKLAENIGVRLSDFGQRSFIAGPARAALATLAVVGNSTAGLAARRGRPGNHQSC